MQLVSKVVINIKKNDVQVQLWTIPGPLFACCIMLALVLKSSFTPLMLPIIAVAGVAACNFWKWKGVAVSSAFLAAMMVYTLQSQPSSSWIWTIALSLTIASTFVLTVLCSEEAHQAMNQLNKGSTDHKQTLSLLNERLQLVQAKLTAEQNEFALQKEQLQEQLVAKEEKQRSNEQLIKLARKEITTVLEKQEKLVEELFQSSEKNGALKLKIAELQSLANNHTHESYDEAVESLQNHIVLLHGEIEQLNRALNESQTKEKRSNQQIECLTKEISELHYQHAIKKDEATEQVTRVVKEYEGHLESILHQKKTLEKTVLTLHEELEAASFQEQEKVKQVERLQDILESMKVVYETNELNYKEKIKAEQSIVQAIEQECEITELHYQEQIRELTNQIEKLDHQKEIILVLNSEKEELTQKIHQLETNHQTKIKLVNYPELRRIENIHQQLREQFAEKSQILTATRKELFLTQEKLLAFQIDRDEAKIDEDKETTELLCQFSVQAEKEFALMEQEHTSEIHYLHEVIEFLEAKLKSFDKISLQNSHYAKAANEEANLLNSN